MTIDLNPCLGEWDVYSLFDPCESEKQICLRTSKRQVWGCDTWLKTGVRYCVT
ncbi:hypothetical protein HanRHA438_Chr03g0124191 [Helianthus annuus]|nr:hypothetical protein HanRHA438_Chr03g0124191 [Helianthus annuus]